MNDETIGIDMSKDRLDTFRLSDGTFRSFDNGPHGFRRLRAWLASVPPARVVYEPTGPYHGAFERACARHLPLVKVNPLQARRFAQANGTRAKTDLLDARMLAMMGAVFELEPDQPAPTDRHDLKELQVERGALVKDRTRRLNRIKTQTLALTRRQTRARLAQVERQLKTIEAEIETRLRQDRGRSLDILHSVPGIGQATAAAILIECPEIGTLRDSQIASLAGLAPMKRQSGRWEGKAFIQGGRKFLRDALYMPALVAIRFNPEMKARYETMRAAGKPAKVAITAVMRKLLELANALVRDDREWTPKYA